jgi:hypothetical protein
MILTTFAVALDPGSLDWRSVATLVAQFMWLVIQRAVRRDTQSDESSVDRLSRRGSAWRSSESCAHAVRKVDKSLRVYGRHQLKSRRVQRQFRRPRTSAGLAASMTASDMKPVEGTALSAAIKATSRPLQAQTVTQRSATIFGSG